MLPRSPLQKKLTTSDVTDICNHAAAAWAQAPSRARTVKFAWRGQTLKSRYTNLRMLVTDSADRPLCCRYA